MTAHQAICFSFSVFHGCWFEDVSYCPIVVLWSLFPVLFLSSNVFTSLYIGQTPWQQSTVGCLQWRVPDVYLISAIFDNMTSDSNLTKLEEQSSSAEDRNNSNFIDIEVHSESMEWSSAVEGRNYEIYIPVFSYLLGMYLITVGKALKITLLQVIFLFTCPEMLFWKRVQYRIQCISYFLHFDQA